MNNIEHVKEVMADREFVSKILAMEEPEDVQKAFLEKGIDFSLEQISQIAEMVMQSENGELSEEALEAVSGGVIVDAIVVGAGLIALGARAMTEYNKERKRRGKSTIW